MTQGRRAGEGAGQKAQGGSGKQRADRARGRRSARTAAGVASAGRPRAPWGPTAGDTGVGTGSCGWVWLLDRGEEEPAHGPGAIAPSLFIFFGTGAARVLEVGVPWSSTAPSG